MTKKNTIKYAAATLLSLGMASANAGPAETTRENPGTVIGAGVGAIAGTVFAGPGIGTYAGTAVGAGVGAIVDNQGKHIDPGPAIGKAARKSEQKIHATAKRVKKWKVKKPKIKRPKW